MRDHDFPIESPLSAPAASEEVPRVDRRVALLSIVGFWALYFILNTLRSGIMDHGDHLAMMGRRTVVTFVGICLTVVLYGLLRRLEGKSMATLITANFVAAVPVSIAYALFNFTAFYLVRPLDSVRRDIEQNSEHVTPFAVVADLAVSWYFFIFAWGVLYVALHYAAKVRHAERNAMRYRAEAQSAQLRALRYQVNPHFLFNTLNSLSALVLQGRNEEADAMIMNLASFFRSSLNGDPTDDVSLADEIRLQQLYLDIERTRFPKRLAVQIDVPGDLTAATVPGMILQPLVENAVKHGVARSSLPVTLTIRARKADGALHLTVENDGDAAFAAPEGHGLGLNNVRDRLSARFNGDATFRAAAAPGGGFRVDMKIPFTTVLAGHV